MTDLLSFPLDFIMTSLRVCALLVLLAVAAVSAHPHHGHGPMHEAMKQDIAECSKEYNIDDVKAALHNPEVKNGCFFNCLLTRAEERMKDSDSPFVKDLAECREANPSTDDQCNDAFTIKVCMKEKMQKKFKEMRNKHAEKEQE